MESYKSKNINKIDYVLKKIESLTLYREWDILYTHYVEKQDV